MTRAGPPLVSPTNEGDTPTLRGLGLTTRNAGSVPGL